ncbi:MAG: WYL domain-containing protein [Ruminococcaceae bacterium]|nr:WYL domain-containing protein [Oscillospiraceae bacterium]
MEDRKRKKYPNLNHGRQHNQKMKPYLIMQYLLKYTDENRPINADNLAEILKEDYGIYAERRSIYRDIEEINKAIIMLEQECTIEEASRILEDDEYNNEKLILKNKYGFYARPRDYEENDIRLLAECVYSAKFLSQSQSKALADIVCTLVNERQAEKIKHDVLLVDRVRTNNAEVLNNILTINEAISKEIDGKKHIPEKISFKYLKHSISDMKKQVERRHGDTYITSPFALIINDGNYYLVAFDDKKEKLINYRVDRMKNVQRIGEKRNGEKEFFNLNLKSYTQRVFSMYGGEEKRITLKFITPLLDAIVDRFGTKDVQYSKSDDRHFTVTAKVEVSDQFFGWILGFGKKVQIVSPPEVRQEFAAYLDKIREMY